MRERERARKGTYQSKVNKETQGRNGRTRKKRALQLQRGGEWIDARNKLKIVWR